MSDRHPSDVDPERFAADDRFVRALLRRLVDDPHLRDDLAQETWLAALRHARGARAFCRAWLGTVARNFALQSVRGSVRRAMRERAAAREVVVDGDVHRDAELHARVLKAVEDLDDPYRAVVRLRFFEDLMPTAIAERLSLPVETVRTRLRRALVRLHAGLGDERTCRTGRRPDSLHPAPRPMSGRSPSSASPDAPAT